MALESGFSIPTLRDLIDTVLEDLNAKLENEDARIRRSEPYAVGHAFAWLSRGWYLTLRFLARQILPDSATVAYLDRWGSIFGIVRLGLDRASGGIDVTGNNGILVPSGTELQSLDGSIVWRTTANKTIALGVANLPVEAVELGTSGNADPGTIAVFAQEIPGVDAEGEVDGDGITGGTDQELDDSYRERILEHIREPPQGGAEADYRDWVKQIGGVDRVFVTPNEIGFGSVGVRFIMEVPEGGTSEDAIPVAGAILAAQDEIDAEKPVTANAVVFPLSAEPQDFTIELYPSGDPDVEAAVEAELNDMFIRRAEPGGTIYRSWLIEAISSAAGEDWHDLISPAGDITIGTNGWPTLGVMTYV